MCHTPNCAHPLFNKKKTDQLYDPSQSTAASAAGSQASAAKPSQPSVESTIESFIASYLERYPELTSTTRWTEKRQLELAAEQIKHPLLGAPMLVDLMRQIQAACKEREEAEEEED